MRMQRRFTATKFSVISPHWLVLTLPKKEIF
jgi:hypothetical protein